MTKFVRSFMFVLVLMSFILAACGAPATQAVEPTTAAVEPTATSVEPTAAIGRASCRERV